MNLSAAIISASPYSFFQIASSASSSSKSGLTPANSEDIDAFVFDNPQQQYVVATDAAVAQSGYLETYDMNTSAGSTTTGKSSATLDIDDTSADAASFRLLRSAEDPENDENAAFRSVVVVPNLIELQS